MALLKYRLPNGTFEAVPELEGKQGKPGKGARALPSGGVITWWEYDEILDDYVDTGIVVSGSVANETVIFPDHEGALTNIQSGSKLSEYLSVIKAWFASLKALAFKDKVNWNTDVDNKPASLPASDVQAWAKAATKPTYTASEVGALPTSHNTSETAHTDIRTEIASVRLVAEGALVGYAFDTVADMNSWIAVAANKAKLKIGNSLFIRATDVPDYWWDGESALPVEGEKVDLSGYMLTSVAENVFVEKEDGKGLSANDFTDSHKARLDFMEANQQLTSVVDIPSLAANTEVSISANAALSIANPENLKSGYVMTIRINNTAATGITVTLPSSSNWINDYGTTLNIDASSRAEVSIWCFKDGYYSIRVGEV